MPKAHGSRLEFRAAGDQSLLVYFADAITPDGHAQVWKMLRLLQSEPVAGVRDLHPAYSSLLINFDCFVVGHAELETAVRRYFERTQDLALPVPRHVEIPVCYGGEFGPDLAEVAASLGMAASQIIKLHAAASYFVYFLGFAPGFAYLGGLPAELAVARLPSPRKRVPIGSVGIAGNQTAVYPFATPGGWRLIGRTPLRLFSTDREEMSLLAMGDVVRFRPIAPEQFAEIAGS